MIISVIILLIAALWLWRQADHHGDRAAMRRLIAGQTRTVAVFDTDMVASLPAAAQRYFRYTIAPGTPLHTVARIRMSGRFGLGDRNNPRYVPMTAEQVLAPPAGFVWTMRARFGVLPMSGSDSHTWTRFWLAGLFPVARTGGDPDHARSAFGRYIAEAVFWTPAALLPSADVQWQELDANRAQVTVTHGGLTQSVTVHVDEEGRPGEVRFQRWSNVNADKVWRLQPFGGYLSEHRCFAGFTLPTRVEAGNQFGTEDYFPFFRVQVDELEFPEPHDRA